MNLSIYDAALAALRVEQTRINAAVTAMEAICASGLSTSVDAINQAMVNAAGIVAPPHEDDDDEPLPPMKPWSADDIEARVGAKRPVLMKAKPGSHEARFLGMRPAVRRIRIVAPPHRVRECTIEDVRSGDVVEILDRPVYKVDPVTREATTELQRFAVGKVN